MIANNRKQIITERLISALNPTVLEIIDESSLHIGHEGAKDGRGHFAVKIISAAFENQSKIARHRMIYAALTDLMETDIHALRIIAADTPDE